MAKQTGKLALRTEVYNFGICGASAISFVKELCDKMEEVTDRTIGKRMKSCRYQTESRLYKVDTPHIFIEMRWHEGKGRDSVYRVVHYLVFEDGECRRVSNTSSVTNTGTGHFHAGHGYDPRDDDFEWDDRLNDLGRGMY